MVNWNSIYNIGKGGAQVWGGNPALEQLERQQYEEQKRREKDNAELTAEMQRVNYDGARQEDLPILIEGFNDVKNTFAELRNARNAQERIKLAAQLADKKAQFTQMVGASKAAIKGIGEIDKLRLTKADELADDFGEGLKALKGTSTFDKEFQSKVEHLTNNAFRPVFDENKYVSDKVKRFVAKVPESEVQVETIQGLGKRGYTTSGEKLDKEAFAKSIITDAVNDKGMQNLIKKRYPDTPISEAAVMYANDVAELADQQYTVKKNTVISKADREPARLTPWQIYQMNKDRDGSGGYNASNVTIAPKVFRKDATAEERQSGKAGRVTLEFTQFAPADPISFDVAQLEQAYDIGRGENIKSRAFKGASITGVGYATAKGGKQQLMATIVDKDGYEYAINFKDIPLKQQSDKYLKAVIARMSKPKADPAPAPKTTSSKTTVKSSSGIKWK